MAEKIDIKDIRTKRKLDLSNGDRIDKLVPGTAFEIKYHPKEHPTRITIALDAKPAEGKILQGAPLAVAVAEYRASHKDIEIDPNVGVTIKYGPTHDQSRVTLLKIIDPPQPET